MSQANIKGCCWALLLLLAALYVDLHKATGQTTFDQRQTADDHDLQISLTEQLTQVMKSLSELQRENAEMSQHIVEIRRSQIESDAASEAQFELLQRADAETKADISAVRELLLDRIHIDNVTQSMILSLTVNDTELKRELKNTIVDIKELIAHNSTAVCLNELRGECAEMKQVVQADIADVKTHLLQISSNNEDNGTIVRFEQLKQGYTQLEINLKATVADAKQHILQQLNVTAESLNTGRQSEQCSNQTKPRDCGDILSLGSTSSGTYMVYAGSTSRPILVYCDMTTDNGGWTVFQRRQDGSENFYRNWVDYANGFGDLFREFWLGNDNLYSLTSNGKRYSLRVDLADYKGNTRYAEYSDFKLGAPWEKYKLVSLGSYNGNAGDSLSGGLRHVGSKFSTPDQDNDSYGGACAVLYKGGWWYDNCHLSNLNGHYYGGPHKSYADGVEWYHWTGYYYSLRFTEMKMR